MATIRNYNAWIKAARKASEKTGGLPFSPAARKACHCKMADRVGRPLKGVDVKKHPRIFKESIPLRSGGRKPAPKRGAAPVRRSVPAQRTAPAPAPRRAKVIRSIEEWERLTELDFEYTQEDLEYASTAEYKSSK